MHIKDQLQKEIYIDRFPTRIVSLVPSITELLYDLNLGNEVAGITKFSVHPKEWHQTKTKIGGTKNIKVNVIASIQPDLIIANKEENVQEQIASLQNIAPVCVTDVHDLKSAIEMIELIGLITNRNYKAQNIIQKINFVFANFRPLQNKLRVCYLVWKEPYMTVGGDTFINDMLERCGFINVFRHLQRYPQINMDDINAADCDVVLLSSEPFPFQQKHIHALQPLLSSAKIILANGEMFSWYGSRLQLAPAYFTALLNEFNQLVKH